MGAMTEQLVEDVAAVYFGAIGATITRGVEIDDAGERLPTGQAVGDATDVLLKGRLNAALHRLDPDPPRELIRKVVCTQCCSVKHNKPQSRHSGESRNPFCS